MRLVTSTPDSVEIRGRGSVTTPLIIGCALLCWPVLATCMAGSAPTGDRLLATLVLLAVASTFIWFGAPKARVIRIQPRERRVRVRGGVPWEIPESAVFRLVAAPAQPVAGPLRYGVALEAAGKAPLLVLVGRDPARVLSDATRLRAVLPLPLVAGWGLSRATVPWLDASAAALEAASTSPEDDPVEPTRRRAMTALGIGTAGAAALVLLEIHGRSSRGDIASPISLVLPALAICLLCVLTFVLGNLKSRILLGTELVFERRLGTVGFRSRSLPASSVESAAVVSPTGRGGRHLLVRTSGGELVAFPCEQSEATRVAARLASPAHPTR
jgi:hypothetical protein